MAVLSNIIVDGVNYTISDAGAVPQTRTVNNKSLDQNIVLTATDVGVLVMTSDEIDNILNSYTEALNEFFR